MSGGKKREASHESGWLSGLLGMLKGGAWGIGVALAVLAIAACLIWLGLLGERAADSATVAACLLGGFLGGLAAVREGKSAPLPRGLGVGAVLFLLLLAAGVLFYGVWPDVRTGGVVVGACLCGGGLAGVLGRGGGKRRRTR